MTETGPATDITVGVRTEIEGGIAVVTLDRPQKRNALRGSDMVAVADALLSVEREQAARAVLLRASGTDFCAGADLSADARGGRQPIGAQMRGLPATANWLIRTIWNCPLPVVAAVQGRAVGLGLHIALASDFLIAGRSALFQEPFAKIGFCGDSGATFLLPRLIGLARAKQMLLRGKAIDADTALGWGLVSEIIEDALLEDAARAIAVELAAGPTFSLGLSKRLLQRHTITSLDEALEAEATAVEISLRSEDFKAGIAAFATRTAPSFSGR